MTDKSCKFYQWRKDDRGQYICNKKLTDQVACMWVFGPKGAPKYAECSGNSSYGDNSGNDKDKDPNETGNNIILGGISNDTVSNRTGINNNGTNETQNGKGNNNEGKDITNKGDNNSNIFTQKITQVPYFLYAT